MHHRLNSLSFFACLALVGAWALAAHAASITASAQKTYGRVNFNFDAPAKLKTSTNGNNAVLTFDRALGDSPEAIKAALPDYVTGASLSADKRTLTLTMTKPYRVRQFVTSNGVGIDLLGGQEKPPLASNEEPKKPEAAKQNLPEDISANAPEPQDADAENEPGESENTAAAKPAAPPTPAPTSTKATPAPAKPAVVPFAKQEPEMRKPAKIVAAPVTPVSARDTEILSTKKTAPAPTLAVKKADEPILSTKSPEAAAPPVAAVKPEEPTPTPAVETAAAAPAAQPSAAPEPAPAAQGEKLIEPAPVITETKAKPKAGPFTVTANTTNGETTLAFPWQERTASALFKRGNDIWVIFSKAQDVNLPLLRTILPKAVAKLTQYDYPKNTVLRFSTDGSVNARVEQPEGSYGWDVVFTTASTKPKLPTTVVVDAIDGNPRLLLGAFDVAPELRFYDPNAGDALVIIPSFENGRGVLNARRFPELEVLSSPQGIAMVSGRSDLAFQPTRAGLVVGSKSAALTLSERLPQLAGNAPIAGESANSGVQFPYDAWYVPPEKFRDTELERLSAITHAGDADKAAAMFELVKLYLSYGFGSEALGVLRVIQANYPEFYVNNKLALLHAAAYVMDYHIEQAAALLQAPELNTLEEAIVWREAVAVFTPGINTAQAIQEAAISQIPVAGTDSANNVPPPATAAEQVPAPAPQPAAPAEKPVFHFLKYNKTFIRYYPPRIRQRLAQIAGDAYLADGQEEKALATYDTLVKDNLLDPVRHDAEFALGRTAEKKGEFDQAYEIYDRLAAQKDDRRIAVRARHAGAMLRYTQKKLTADEAAEILEGAHTSWRGDEVDQAILRSLVGIYDEAKRYDNVLRTYKTILEIFPTTPDALSISNTMSNLFERVFLDGLAEEMQPLKALSLFYEFRDLTPLGEKGDKMIQKLADRLAAIDLLDRATQLLDNQIKFRATGEARSQIGARLALLYLLDRKPQDALTTLEVTNFGGNSPGLIAQRRQLTAEALTKLGKHEEALGVVMNDPTPTGALLKLDILWALQDWPSIVNQAEDILNSRSNLTEPLSNTETEVLLKLALGYAFESDYTQLRYLRDYYASLIPDNGYKQIFEFITNDTTPLDPEDFALLAQQISRTESFLNLFRTQIANGKLSEAIP